MLWGWVEKVPEADRRRFGIRRVVRWGLEHRMRSGIRFRKASYSLPTAVRTGLQMGLPWAALLAAIMPVLGMSWYFDTENWASGVWDSWAAARTDIWREAMSEASGEKMGPDAYRLQPQDVRDTGDFSFLVIGDPGEGDASQLILKDQILAASAQPGVKFLVISSDVIYPTGAMKDYEKKFYLPMKGVTKPVYAIPGNHDWYDALEGFAANFYRPDIARRAMQARVNRDLHISTTTEKHIDDLIDQAGWLRKEYGVPTGHQQAPFFQVSAGNFVLLCVDTGVLRQVDSTQMAWIRAVLEASKGKFVMALLGHPFYAAGEYQGSMNPQFEEMHALFRKYKVPMVMAGDTHDMEYYIEPGKEGDNHTMHHFVNGGGGAYLSIGAALTPAENMPTREYAIYPQREPLVRKIEDNTAWYKYPAWWWTRQHGGWPFSAEWLSAAFDYNVAPFFQSFMEVRVDRSHGLVRIIPYSNNGRLRWTDMTATPGARPAGTRPEDLAEWAIPLHP